MADEEQVTQDAGQVNETDTATAEQYQDLDERIDAKLKEVEERYKKEISGLNRRNTELEKKLQEKTKVEKTAEEQLEELRQQLHQKEIREMRISKVAEVGMPEIAGLFDYDLQTAEGIDDFVGALNKIITDKANAQTQAEIDKRFPQKEPPKTGPGDNGRLTYEQILKNPDVVKGKTPEQINALFEQAVYGNTE